MSPFRMEKIESASRSALELNKAFNRYDVNRMAELITDDCVFESHGPAPNGATYKGKEATKGAWKELFDRSPDIKMEIEEMFGMGNRCILMWRSKGRDAEEKDIGVRGVDIYQVRSGLIFKIFSYVKG